MSQVALLGAVEIGLVFALVGLGVYLAFRVLDFPDLTVDGSFPLGAAVAATMIVAGVNPWLASLGAMAAGAVAGLVTATLNVRFRILHLLASILTMIALFSVNLRVMGRPNVALIAQETVLTPFYGLGVPEHIVRPLFVLVVVAIVVLLLARFLGSEFGLAMRATGVNARMARAQGVSTDLHVYVGMALSNALVGLAGALFAQTNGFADVTAGIGTIVVGLAAVIVGETVFRARRLLWILVGCVFGSIVYRLAIQFALSADVIGLQASDLNLVTAVLVAVALILPRVRVRAGGGRAPRRVPAQ
ncbi:ABC transporter permease [Arenibaculum sp.]|jgi:putative ABC transport system permease protein|uniref:ABC transporter permease n=1 Tax=Arenibaculum sp. TaxID=2865862 RepID=UPI002E1289AA|nr:ABC transporter permease [Arenibaculum sp.]